MAAEGMQFPWRGNRGTVSLNLGVIWVMSVKASSGARVLKTRRPGQMRFGVTTHSASRTAQIAKPETIRMTASTFGLARGFVEVHALGPSTVKET